MPPAGQERRTGTRRRQLPQSHWRQWPSLLASALLGVITAVVLQSARGAPEAGRWFAELPGRVPVAAPDVTVAAGPRFSAAEAAALRDEAEGLTAAAVALDEQAQTRWWPLRPALEAAVLDPRTSEEVRGELEATLAALLRVGL